MKLLRTAVLLALAHGFFGCGGQTEYRQVGGVYAGRGPDCEFRVIRGRITEPYEEVGIIDVEAFHSGSLPDDEEAFKRVVTEDVCRVGGHAIIPAIDVYGHWVVGTVIRFHPARCARCRDPVVPKEGG